MGFLIAVDGPASSGKGTIARSLAAHFGLPHLDTGALYRAVAMSVLGAGDDPADAEAAARHAAGFDEALLADPALRTAEAGNAASVVSVHPAVRTALLARQRVFAARKGGAVLDGRDIGTVIAPHADVKLFVTAALDERARRRTAELKSRGLAADYEEIRRDLAARDERDKGRGAAPLSVADDAFVLDTTQLSVREAIDAAIALVSDSRAD